jgi:uncharacterized protein (TIGR03437 family)
VPLYYAKDNQVNGQAPYETPSGDRWARVFTASGSSLPQRVAVAATAPGVFLYGESRAVATNPDGSVNGPSNGTGPGTYITVYLTGIGQLDNPLATGQIAPFAPLSRPLAAFKVTVGGVAADVYYLGLAPKYVGLAQANVRIPDLPPGDYPLFIEVGGAVSAATLVTVR